MITHNEKAQIVLLLISDDLFNRFVHLIGVRMIDDELVMENDTEGVRNSLYIIIF